jgi:DNA-binding MarR family transcriptional regulator
MPEPDLSDHTVSILISVLYRVMLDEIQAGLDANGYDDLNANLEAFEVIDTGGTRLSTMAERARLTKQSMGEQVARLERLGYLQRSPDPTDGRAKLVRLTARGEEATTAAIGALAEMETSWLEALGAERAAALREALVELCLKFGGQHIR